MRYRSDGPQVMDFLIVSLFLKARTQGYRAFNLGMAPLASVGEQRGAHARERLARLLFQRGEQWYNFQGLRVLQGEVRSRNGCRATWRIRTRGSGRWRSRTSAR